jgi:hypothetical protein
MTDTTFLEPNDNIDTIIDIMSSSIDKINKFAGFNIHKRIHPSYSKQIETLIPSLKPISLSSFTKPFPESKKEILLPPPRSPKKEILLPPPRSPKKEILLPPPRSPKKEIILPTKKEIILPTKKEIILPSKKPILPLPTKKEILPLPIKKEILLPTTKKEILPLPTKKPILLPKSPVKPILLPKEILSPRLPKNDTSELKTIYVTNLKPNIPNINNFNKKSNKIELPKTKFPVEEVKILLPQLMTTIHSENSRPIIISTQDSITSKIIDIDDKHRKILSGNHPDYPKFKGFDFSKLSETRHGKNNETYDLPYVKELAKSLGLSSKGNKDVIIERIRQKAAALGFNLK